MVMSDNGQTNPSGRQNQSHTVSTHHLILSENPTLTDEQRAQSFKVYEGRLEQAAAAHVQAIA